MFRSSVVTHFCRALVLSALLPWSVWAEPIPRGPSTASIRVGETDWNVHTYKPACYNDGPLVVVFHGTDRNPALARDNAVPLADAGCAVAVAPLFDADRFPRWVYQFGGLGDPIATEGRTRLRLRPDERRTGRLVLALIEALRQQEGRPDMPYYLIGHSAGAQFLSRFAAFYPQEAVRIVLANPGSYVAPSWDARYPYGFGGLTVVDEAARKRYVAAPLVFLLATMDRTRHGLDRSRLAEQQGATRYERGLNVYWQAFANAKREGTTFGWSIIEVPGLSHGSARLYARPEAAVALFGRLAGREDDRPSELDVSLRGHGSNP
jgi:pimeloyl-ACP methyl ester carboxylesterase